MFIEIKTINEDVSRVILNTNDMEYLDMCEGRGGEWYIMPHFKENGWRRINVPKNFNFDDLINKLNLPGRE